MLRFSSRLLSLSNISKLSKNQSFVRHHHVQLVYTELGSRSLIRVTGSETYQFLQGLITNDIHNLQSQKSIFALFLNQAGRVLFDSILYRSFDDILIECDTHVQQTLIRHLKLYRVRRNVQIEDVASELRPWVIWNPSHNDIPTGLRQSEPAILLDVTDHSTDHKTKEDLLVSGDISGICDPRLDALGWRLLLPEKLKDIETSNVNLKLDKSTEIDYRILLYSLGVGEGFLDFPISNSFPLESNADLLHGVNFHKGCYIGQELTARTHHTGVVRKRLMPFRLPEDAKISSEVDKAAIQLLNPAGKPIARVRNIVNSYGLALARIEEVLASNEIKLGDHLVKIQRPSWWPVELSREKKKEK